MPEWIRMKINLNMVVLGVNAYVHNDFSWKRLLILKYKHEQDTQFCKFIVEIRQLRQIFSFLFHLCPSWFHPEIFLIDRISFFANYG